MMTYLDMESATDFQIVAQYLCEHLLAKPFLPYEDYEIVKAWLAFSGNIDVTLAVLDEVIADLSPRKTRLSVKMIDKRVLRKLENSPVS